MAENPNKKKNFIPKTPQKPNYQVWIILSLAILVFSIFYFNQSGGLEEITERRFEEMAMSGHVKEIIIINFCRDKHLIFIVNVVYNKFEINSIHSLWKLNGFELFNPHPGIDLFKLWTLLIQTINTLPVGFV